MLTKETPKETESCPDFFELAKPGVVVKLETKNVFALYRFSMITADRTIICKAVDRPLAQDYEVGSMVTLVRSMEEGSCLIQAKIVGVSEKGEIIALLPIGIPEKAERRVFPRVRIENAIHLKLQFDRFNSRYKSTQVYDISGGGVGVSIYAKNPIGIGHTAKIEIEINGRHNKIVAIGQVMHCTLRNAGAREYLLGIRFTEISVDDQQKIITYVAEEHRKQEEQDAAHRRKELVESKAKEEAEKAKEEKQQMQSTRRDNSDSGGHERSRSAR